MIFLYVCVVYIVCNVGYFNYDFIIFGKLIYIKLFVDIWNFGWKYN